MSLKSVCDTQKQRIAYLTISPKLIVDLLKVPPEGVRVGDALVTVSEQDFIPLDAEGLRAGIDANGNVNVIMRSEDFPLTAEDQPVTQIKPLYGRETIGVESCR